MGFLDKLFGKKKAQTNSLVPKSGALSTANDMLPVHQDIQNLLWIADVQGEYSSI